MVAGKKTLFNVTAIIQPAHRLKSVMGDSRTDEEKAAAVIERKIIKELQKTWAKRHVPSSISKTFNRTANEAENSYMKPDAAKFFKFSTACWTSQVWQDHTLEKSADSIIVRMRLKNTQQPQEYHLVVHTKNRGSRVYHGTIGNLAAVRLSKTHIMRYPCHPHHVTALPDASNYEKMWVKENYDGKIPKAMVAPISATEYVVRPSMESFPNEHYYHGIRRLAKEAVIDSIDEGLSMSVKLQ